MLVRVQTGTGDGPHGLSGAEEKVHDLLAGPAPTIAEAAIIEAALREHAAAQRRFTEPAPPPAYRPPPPAPPWPGPMVPPPRYPAPAPLPPVRALAPKRRRIPWGLLIVLAVLLIIGVLAGSWVYTTFHGS